LRLPAKFCVSLGEEFGNRNDNPLAWEAFSRDLERHDDAIADPACAFDDLTAEFASDWHWVSPSKWD
jgi:hypothetical protein